MTTIQVLGTGCKKCSLLQENAEAALKELGLDADVQKIEDINEIIKFGVMSTPALAIDGEVKIVGRVATPEEIKAVLPQ
jgi:small redox-active disulfide protein 2